jgi:hypothetical protein
VSTTQARLRELAARLGKVTHQGIQRPRRAPGRELIPDSGEQNLGAVEHKGIGRGHLRLGAGGLIRSVHLNERQLGLSDQDDVIGCKLLPIDRPPVDLGAIF